MLLRRPNAFSNQNKNNFAVDDFKNLKINYESEM